MTKTRTREIFESAYATFDRSDEITSLLIDAVIESNPHRVYRTGLYAVLSALYAVNNQVRMNDCAEICEGSLILSEIYFAGRHYGCRLTR